MVSAILSRVFILTCGTLYPAYRSYKAIRTKNVKEYVKWMMYWVVFAMFLFLETLADIFIAFWLPFYYELKILFVVWLLSPYTKGASFLYRRLIHPALTRHEPEIDEYIDRAKREGLMYAKTLSQQGIQYAKEVVATVAIRGQNHIIKSLSMGDLSGTNSDNLPIDTNASFRRRRVLVRPALPQLEEVDSLKRPVNTDPGNESDDNYDVEEDQPDGPGGYHDDEVVVYEEGYIEGENGSEVIEREFRFLETGGAGEAFGSAKITSAGGSTGTRRSSRTRPAVSSGTYETVSNIATLPKSTGAVRTTRKPRPQV